MPTHEYRMDLVTNPIEAFPWWMMETTDLLMMEADEVPLFMVDNWQRRYDVTHSIKGRDTVEEIYEKLLVLGSNARLQWLSCYYDTLPVDKLRALLPRLWVEPNMLIDGPMGLDADTVREWFAITGFVTDGPERPTETTRLYHGTHRVNGFNPDLWESFCWTSDRAVAEKFAKAYLYATDSPPSNVLGRFDSRGESEYVLDPLQIDRMWLA